MDDATKREFGQRIKDRREERPIISVKSLAEEARLAANTVSAVQRGEGEEGSLEKVLRAMERLGRPIEIEWPERTERQAGYPHPAEAFGTMVTAILRASPPDEALVLEADIWSVVRGRPEEVCERHGLGKPTS
jgi:transcriptional regulator with XRE-family HTH domain